MPNPPCISQPEQIPGPQQNPESPRNGDGASTSSGTAGKLREDWEVYGYDLLSQLEKFSLCDSGEGINLTAEVVLLNEQRQEDELLALDAIFGDNVTVSRDKDTGLRYVQIQICREFLDGINVSVELQEASKSTGTEKKSCDDFVYQFIVRYLPPITLICLMPASYPSHRVPYFVISAMWLDQSKLSVLCG